METKLPRADYDKLVEACKNSADGAGAGKCQAILDRVLETLDGEFDPEATAPLSARQRLLVLNELGSALACDGLLIGVACNQPELVVPAINMARGMEMPNRALKIQTQSTFDGFPAWRKQSNS